MLLEKTPNRRELAEQKWAEAASGKIIRPLTSELIWKLEYLLVMIHSIVNSNYDKKILNMTFRYISL